VNNASLFKLKNGTAANEAGGRSKLNWKRAASGVCEKQSRTHCFLFDNAKVRCCVFVKKPT